MKFLLDTNACITYLNGRSEPFHQRFERISDEEIAICSVVRAELRYGAMKSNARERILAAQNGFFSRFISIPFDDSAAEAYSQIRPRLEAEGRPIGSNDMLIAAIALSRNLILVTNNTSEFSRVGGLRIEDWQG